MSLIRPRFPAALACAAALASAGSVRAQPKAPNGGKAPAQPANAASGSATENNLDDAAKLAGGVNLYDSGQYQKCASDFADLLNPAKPNALRDPHAIETARVYYAACLLGSNHPAKEADKPLRDAIRDNPQMKPPDSTIFPQVVIDEFLKVRQSMLEFIHKQEQARIKAAQVKARNAAKAERERRERIARLKKLASEETIITKNSRWLAAIPFGVGQFANRQPAWGWTFLTSEAALAGTASAMIILESHYTQQAFDPGKAAALKKNHKTAQTVLIATGWSFVGVAALGVLQAELAYKPEFHDGVRPRRLPPDLEKLAEQPSIMPSGGPLAGGGFALGLTGRF